MTNTGLLFGAHYTQVMLIYICVFVLYLYYISYISSVLP